MRYTFKPDDCMVITIPINNISNAGEGQLMPDKFICRFKDNYKVFQRGRPKALGVAQIVIAVFIMCLGGILESDSVFSNALILSLPSVLHLVSGSLVVAAAHTPLMPTMKASFVFNVLSLCLALIMASLICAWISLVQNDTHMGKHVNIGLNVLVVLLYMLEFVLSVILIHWESKALCRAHFNSLPMITLKQDMGAAMN